MTQTEQTEQQQVEDAIVATIQEALDSWNKLVTKWQKVESVDLDHKLPEGLIIRDWVDQAMSPDDRQRWLTAGGYNPKTMSPGDRQRWLTAGGLNPKKCRELEDAGFSPAEVSERIYKGRSIANLYCTEEMDIEMVAKMVFNRQNP